MDRNAAKFQIKLLWATPTSLARCSMELHIYAGWTTSDSGQALQIPHAVDCASGNWAIQTISNPLWNSNLRWKKMEKVCYMDTGTFPSIFFQHPNRIWELVLACAGLWLYTCWARVTLQDDPPKFQPVDPCFRLKLRARPGSNAPNDTDQCLGRPKTRQSNEQY